MNLIKNLAIIILSNIIFINNAYAYIDPGTGSIILQAILALFASIAVFFTSFLSKAKSILKKIFKKKNKN